MKGMLPFNMLPRFLAGGKKFHDPEEVAVIGQGKMPHPHGFRLVRQGLNRNRRVLQGKI
jgi:hypothetical protein